MKKFATKLSALLVGLFCSTAMSTAASAITTGINPLWEFSSAGNETNPNPPPSLQFGSSFDVVQTTDIYWLGYYAGVDTTFDSGNQHIVSLFDSNDQRLASATVDNTSILQGHFRWTPIKTVTLIAGNSYHVDSESLSDSYTYNDPDFWYRSDLITHPIEIYQTPPVVSDGYWGANLATPEPGTWALMGIGGVLVAVSLKKSGIASVLTV